MTAPANWYQDPADPARLRYWDGAVWTEHVAVATPPAPYPGAASQTRHYGPTTTSGTLSMLGVGLVVLLEVGAAAVSVPSYSRLADAVAEGADPAATLTRYDAVVGLSLLAILFAGISAGIWLWGARRNAEALRPQARHARSRGWVWGGWICPVVNLWFPYQVVRDVNRATDRRGGGRAGWWWGAYLLYNVLWSVNSVVGEEVGSASEIRDLGPVMAVLHGITAVAGLVAAVLWVLTVRRVQRDQAAAASAGSGDGTASMSVAPV